MIKALASSFKKRLQKRSIAYNKVFEKKSPHTHEVLLDLASFCRAHGSTFHKNERVHAMLEGRREVWLRIQENLNLDIEELYALHKVKEIDLGDQQDGKET